MVILGLGCSPDKTVLQLTREAATLVSTAIEGIGDPFALHGFASDGRHDVQYFRLKDFNRKFFNIIHHSVIIFTKNAFYIGIGIWV
jgi:nitric oxide reductase activation protein